ncbi:AAA family ATPase [Fodinicola acaciae]|uniref:AAA family ATPase n=1 Tax=Fodinicola acaciae TaxID=2681555 RepID=UPI0013D66BC7|nr:AAA family ATPase [Fodinicola acaciae]
MKPFVGRETELRALLAAADEAAAGQAGLVVVTGEPGMGKTRLLRECAETAAKTGFVVHTGRCWAGGDAPALWPWPKVLSELGQPELGEERVPRFARFMAIVEAVRAASAEWPRLLILDDLHLADPDAILVTRMLAAEAGASRLLVLVSRRSTEPRPGTPSAVALADLAREGSTIALTGLTRDDVRAYLAAVGQHHVDAVRLRAATGGNPLFLSEVVAHGQRPPPATVREVIDARLRPLARSTVSVLARAAVLGAESTVEEIAAISGVSARAVMAVVADAVAAELAEPADGRLRFVHDLVREALEDSLPAGDRLEAHAKAAAIFAVGNGSEHVTRCAHHAVRAAARGRVDAEFAVHACRRAAADAVRATGYERAAAWLAQAVDVLDRGHLHGPRAPLLTACAEALRSAGQLAAARSAFEVASAAATAEADAVMLGRSALGLGGVWINETVTAIDAERILALQRRALATLPPDEHALRVRLEARIAAVDCYAGGPDEPVRQALARARALGDPDALGEALSMRHHTLMGPAGAEERIAVARELVEVATRAGNDVLALYGRCWATIDAFLVADPDAERALADLRVRARSLGHLGIGYVVDILDIMLLLRDGEVAEAEQRAEGCLAGGLAAGDPDAYGWFGTQMLTIRWLQDRAGELGPVAAELHASAYGPEKAYAAMAALVMAAGGDLDGARRCLATYQPRGPDDERLSSTWLGLQVLSAEAARLLDDRELAAATAARLEPYARLAALTSFAVVCLGSVERSLGVCAMVAGQSAVAAEHFAAAVADNDKLGNRPFACLARGELADALAATGDEEAAIAHWRGAAAAAAEMGLARRAASWRTRADAAARRAAEATTGVLERDGRGWCFRIGPRTVEVAHSRGMAHLAVLLGRPGRSVPAGDLAGWIGGESSQEVLDASARHAYRHRLADIDAELADAEACADLGRVDRARAERQALLGEIARHTGVGGRARTFVDSKERARTAVQKALRRALEAVAAGDADLGARLKAAIVTGADCVYEPGPGLPRRWIVRSRAS